MSTTISAVISNKYQCNHDVATGATTYSGVVNKTYSLSLSSTDVTKEWNDTRTTSGETLDLTSLTDAFGATVNFAHVKALVIVNNDSTNTLTVGGGTNPVFAALPAIQAGGQLSMSLLNLAISGTAKNLVITPSASLSYSIYLVGN